MNSVVIGRYFPGDSFIHRLDPRTKILVTFIFVLIMFWAKSWLSYLIASLFVGTIIGLSQQSIGRYMAGLKPILGLMLFTVLLQMFLTPGPDVLWRWGWLTLTQTGMMNAIKIAIRFLLIILMSTVLTLTTPPTSIANALESLLGGLKKIKVPIAELALMLSIALRFVPLLMDETVKIMNAQKSRGMNFNEGGIIKRAKAFAPLLIPLFISALNRALELANAMEVRGFKDADHRTKYRVLHYGKLDGIALIGLAVFVVAFLTTVWLPI